mmetsp:Transcript_97599/g.260479  ORF Transcript_97599/g.260479 Transcript_97599/m.260479 type:complete len:325 (+) Transcript_97599:707-1681(+)
MLPPPQAKPVVEIRVHLPRDSAEINEALSLPRLELASAQHGADVKVMPGQHPALPPSHLVILSGTVQAIGKTLSYLLLPMVKLEKNTLLYFELIQQMIGQVVGRGGRRLAEYRARGVELTVWSDDLLAELAGTWRALLGTLNLMVESLARGVHRAPGSAPAGNVTLPVPEQRGHLVNLLSENSGNEYYVEKNSAVAPPGLSPYLSNSNVGVEPAAKRPRTTTLPSPVPPAAPVPPPPAVPPAPPPQAPSGTASSIEGWLRTVDRGTGRLMPYLKGIVDNFDDLDELALVGAHGTFSNFFEAVGVTKLGHRERLQEAISQLSSAG